jgi:tetratricopeptide (TPR) repeat protein
MKLQIYRRSANEWQSIRGFLIFVLTVLAILCVPVIGNDTQIESAAAWNENGTSLYSQGKYNESIQAFNNALEFDPVSPQIWYNMGNAFYSLGKYDEAITAYDKVVELDPTYAYAWFAKGKALNYQTKYDEAIQCFNKSIELNPRDSEAWYNKGYALLKLSKNDEAIQSLDKVIEIDPKNANAWYDKGYALYKQNKYDEAIEAFDKAIEIDPQRAAAWHQKGVALAEQGKFDEAIRAYDEAIRLDPNFADAWVNKGFALQNQGKDLEAALIWMVSLQKINSTNKNPQATNATKPIQAALAPATAPSSTRGVHVESWQKTFGGSLSDRAFSVQQTSDGGYIIAGDTNSYGAGESDAWLIKTDANGNKVWDRTFGGSLSDRANSVQQTNDDGYIIAGWTYGSGWHDAWLIKTDANGNKVWDRTFGGSYSDTASSVQQTSDGGYIIAGDTVVSYGSNWTVPYIPDVSASWQDAWLIKTDSAGNKLWDKTFGGSENDRAFSVQQTSDGGYIVTGSTESYGAGESDAWLIKTDANGNKVWDRTFGGSLSDRASSVQHTSDGGYIVTGSTESYGAGESDAWLIKTDANGNKVWDRTFGRSNNESASSVQQTSDGGYIIAGSIDESSRDTNAWLIKTDSSGNKLWDKTFGESGSDGASSRMDDSSYEMDEWTRDNYLIEILGANFDSANAIRQTSNGGYIIAGSTYSYGSGLADAWLIKTDANGNVVGANGVP